MQAHVQEIFLIRAFRDPRGSAASQFDLPPQQAIRAYWPADNRKLVITVQQVYDFAVRGSSARSHGVRRADDNSRIADLQARCRSAGADFVATQVQQFIIPLVQLAARRKLPLADERRRRRDKFLDGVVVVARRCCHEILHGNGVKLQVQLAQVVAGDEQLRCFAVGVVETDGARHLQVESRLIRRGGKVDHQPFINRVTVDVFHARLKRDGVVCAWLDRERHGETVVVV